MAAAGCSTRPLCPQSSQPCQVRAVPWPGASLCLSCQRSHADPDGFQPPTLLLSPVCGSGAVWSTRDGANHLQSLWCLWVYEFLRCPRAMSSHPMLAQDSAHTPSPSEMCLAAGCT